MRGTPAASRAGAVADPYIKQACTVKHNEMRILVTGGGGFVGRHLCSRLLDQGHEVVALDSHITSDADALRELRVRPGFETIVADVCEPFGRDQMFDRIYHLACPASPPLYQADPIHTAKTGFLGTLHALGVTKRCAARMVYASTSEIYGDPDVSPQEEAYRGNVSCTGIRACYDEGKRIGETLCQDYRRVHGVDVRIARIFNTYGPGMDRRDGRVVSNFVCQALQGQPLTLYGDGKQTRSFCYVSDLVDGLIALMEWSDADGEPVNLGNPEEYAMRDLATKVVDMSGSASAIVFLPLPSDDPRQRRPNIERAKRVLGWEPTVRLTDGLRLTIEHFSKSTAP